MNEFDLIARYFSPPTSHTFLAGGDDAALLVPSPGHVLAVTTDMLVEGTHFLPTVDPESLGHKVLAVNLSDIAAMGARPKWAFLSLALPAVDEAWIAAFARGFLSLARRYDVDLAGGDTTRGPRNFNVTLVGEVPASQALRRDGAKEGEDLWVSGCTGEAALGLRVRLGQALLDPVDAARCAGRLEWPEPRVSLGRLLADLATSAIDISDGLAADVGHIGERSSLQACIEWERLPQSSAFATIDESGRRGCILAGGDDYELAFTAPASRRRAIEQVARLAGVPVTRIGVMRAGRGVTIVAGDGRALEFGNGGFDHFR
ncbi:MAG: thiamine-phosphate kinase [Burkholderiales bacterium]